jgi:hypothetical protein
MYSHFVSNKPMIGSRSAWIATRIAETVVLALLLVLMPPLLLHPSLFRVEGTGLVAFSGVFGALILAGFAQAHQIVYGFPKASGIHYRRYFRWKHVHWDQIESISTRPLMNTIHVDTVGNGFFDQHLVFVKDTVVFGRRSESVTFENLREMWIQTKRLG